jgi:tetratricopeptide (TPR) repeat protein
LVIKDLSLHGATESPAGWLVVIAATHMNDVTELPLTDGTIALLNLRAQIEGLEPDVRLGHATIESRVSLIDLITLRGLIIGYIADYQRADEMAEQLVCDAATDGTAFVARARTRAVFHRFADALDDIDRAERLGLNSETTNGDRAAIFQALGRYDEALAIREEAADRRASFENVATLVGLYAERGDVEAADCTRKAAGDTAVSHRFRWRCSTSSWA